MTETFTPRRRNSSELFTYLLKDRPCKQLQVSVRDLKRERKKPDNPWLYLELFVLFTIIILWITSATLLIFSAYILYDHYTISLITDTYDFLIIYVIMQTTSSLTLAATAMLTCSCMYPDDNQVPKLAKKAIFFLSFGIIILSTQIGLSLYNRFIPDENLDIRMMHKLQSTVDHIEHLKGWNDIQLKLTCCGVKSKDDWTAIGRVIPMSCCNRSQDGNCVTWQEKGCSSAYSKVKINLLNYLTGEASICLANSIISLTILVKLLSVSMKMKKRRKKMKINRESHKVINTAIIDTTFVSSTNSKPTNISKNI